MGLKALVFLLPGLNSFPRTSVRPGGSEQVVEAEKRGSPELPQCSQSFQLSRKSLPMGFATPTARWPWTPSARNSVSTSVSLSPNCEGPSVARSLVFLGPCPAPASLGPHSAGPIASYEHSPAHKSSGHLMPQPKSQRCPGTQGELGRKGK